MAHNASFDLDFLTASMKRLNLPGKTFIYVDTLRLARQKIKEVKWHKLPILKKYLKLEYNSHLAEDDCYVCYEVYKYCRGLSTIQKASFIGIIEESKDLSSKWHKLPILKKYLKLEYNSHLAEDDCYVCYEVYKYCRGLSTIQKASFIGIIEESKDLSSHSLSKLSEIELETLIEAAKEQEENSEWDKAIYLYEQCISSQCDIKEPYDRLILLYRKKRQKENEVRVLEVAIQLFPYEDKYQIRLEKINSI